MAQNKTEILLVTNRGEISQTLWPNFKYFDS